MRSLCALVIALGILSHSVCFGDIECSSTVWDSSGNMWASGLIKVGDMHAVQVSRLPFGGDWQNTAILSDPSLEANPPRMATNSLGDVIVVWISSELDSEFRGLYASTLSHESSTWSQPVKISSNNVNVLSINRVGIFDNGNMVAVWNFYLDSGEYSYGAANGNLTTGWTDVRQFPAS